MKNILKCSGKIHSNDELANKYFYGIYVCYKIRATAPKRASADLAMATVQEEQKSIGELEVDLTEKQNLLEKQKLEYDERVVEKEHLIAKVG